MDRRPTVPDGITPTAVVEVKRNLSAVRELRDGLVLIARVLADQKGKWGYLLLINPRLSVSCLMGEAESFKATMRPNVAGRLRLVIVKAGEIVQGSNDVRPADSAGLRRRIKEEAELGVALPRPRKQDEVFLVVLHQWITGQGLMTSKWLGDSVGCNYRTVSAALDRLGPAISRRSDRRVSLKHFPEREWKRFTVLAHKVRATTHYTDTSDQPRSPESLLRRLARMGRQDIAVGGVLGARHYDEDLDIVGTPRLDLCLHAPGDRADLDFVRELDPALEPTQDPHRPVRLALHFLRRRETFFDAEGAGLPYADPLECLAELCIAGLDPQAMGFQDFLVTRGRGLSGGL